MDKRHGLSLLSLGLAVVLAGCGVAAESGAEKPSAAAAIEFGIETSVLPAASVGVAYDVPLRTQSAVAAVTWMIQEGTLPQGLELSPEGHLVGEPTERGVSTFDVAATDGRRTAARTLLLAVDTFAIALDGLHFGEVWSESPITLIAVGQEGPVAFEILENGDGGAFDFLDERAGRAIYVPSPTTTPTEHHIRAVDQVTGEVTDIILPVLPHPAPNFVAEFGQADVWYVDCANCLGQSALPRDWDSVLHGLGLRSDAFVPTTADRLADWYVRLRILSELNVFFLRNADGTQGDGLLISFPMDRPDAPFEAPAPGTWTSGAGHRYNVISVHHGRHGGILGMAFEDSQANDLIENDTGNGGDVDLGVFGNQVAHSFNVAFQNTTLPANPLTDDDTDLLRDLVHGRAIEGERAHLIRRAADKYARCIAMVLAHEIGHSLGLPHTERLTPGSMMNGGAAIYPGAEYFFLDSDVARLRNCLPGPGRAGETYAAGTTHTPRLPQGGVQPCRLRVLPRPCSCEGCGPHAQ